MVRLAMLLPATVAVAADPDMPHLAQAWTARSSGNGPDDTTVGQESYLNTKEKQGHIWDYGAAGGKITRCGKDFEHMAGCKAYYLKLYGPNCCYCNGASFKEWDIHNKGKSATSSFVGIEDTTELDDNPITGAEHWHEDDTLFGKLKLASYDYFLHREDNGDVISHRINYFAAAVNGSILYGDFQVPHDIDAFASAWDIPTQCQGNILDCHCDVTDEVHQKYFKHEYALAKAKADLVAV
jgi:hypothetical protein